MNRVSHDGVRTVTVRVRSWASRGAAAVACAAVLLGTAARAEIAPPPAEYHPSRVLVQLAPTSVASAPIAEVAAQVASDALPARSGDRQVRSVPLVPNLFAVDVETGTVLDAVEALRADPRVLFAEPDFKIELTAVPNEPAFQLQWAMRNIGQTPAGDPGTPGADANAVGAWDFVTTAEGFRIGIVDSGIELAHPDLRNNLWENPGEIPGNGIDDDANGFIDDFNGFNVVDRTGDVSDVVGHGTHVAGIVAARGNNGFGIAGMAWDTELVILRLTDESGSGFISDAITAINYMVLQGIPLSNNSWGCYQCESQALQSAIGAAGLFGHLFVASAGNGVFGLGIDAARFPFYPAAYDLPNVISVTASDNDDEKPKFANFGKVSVDIAAPGVNIYSTARGPNYEFRTGTSMAAPLVTGTAALIWSQNPSLGYARVKERILLTARPAAAFADRTVAGGILDAGAAVGDCNGNGVFDADEIDEGAVSDCNGNDLPDDCEPDCNGNGLADGCDITMGGLADCNQNLIPDECEPDCDQNGIADECDLAAGARDCNSNDVPDVCEPGNSTDCNDNGFADLCDLGVGRSFDCNENFIPDECDIASGTSLDCGDNGLPDECERDCNGNGVADGCDIALGDALDEDGDGVPDECSLGFVVRPMSASRPYAIRADEISVVQGESNVRFDVFLSGWDPDQDGDRRLRAFQVGLDRQELVGATADLELADVACEDDEDCFATSECEPNGTCDSVGSTNVDEGRADYVFANIGTIVAVDPSTFRIGVTTFLAEEAPIDPGSERYAGTFILRVPPDATGEFRITLNPDESFLSSGSAPEDRFPDTGLIGATLRIAPDCNGNELPDDEDILLGISDDCDDDGIPDECVEERNDCNLNANPDSCDIESGTSTDCNGNGVPDECLEFEADCNRNDIPDACDIDAGVSEDCNGNRIPDECLQSEDDCNFNGVPDACDIADGTVFDCDKDGVPDVCGNDCNGNDLADSCDILAGRSADAEGNGVPDECQTPRRVPQEYATIQDAVMACEPGDPVVLSAGTYTGFGNTYVEFFGKVLTVVCPPSEQPCIVDAGGEGYAFFFYYGEDRRTILDGLTIRNARDSSMIMLESSPTIRRCVIEECGPSATGIQVDQGSSPLFDRCIIRNNSASFSGGGLRSDSSFPVLVNTLVENNFAGSDGGGIYAINGRIEIYNSVIRDNFAQRSGGGVAFFQDMGIIRNSEILGNTADPTFGSGGDGGGIWIRRSDAAVEGCVITGNFARSGGGGVFVDSGEPGISNTTIADNDAIQFGGGLYWIGSDAENVSCCSLGMCDNSVTRAECEAVAGTVYPDLSCADVTCGTQSCCMPEGGCENMGPIDCINLGGEPRGIGTQCASDDCTPSVANVILWGNSAVNGREIYTGSSVLTIANSTVSGGFGGDDISGLNPLFVERGTFDRGEWIAGDYSLLRSSPAIDLGDDLHVPPGLTQDVVGAPRVLCQQVDQGAYERGAGDFDCDGIADLADFGAWEGCMTGPDQSASILPLGCAAFDLDVNGRVDLRDFARLALTVLSPPA